MKKMIVIGCPGSGKSTFSRQLRDKMNIPLYYLDQIWHKSDKTTVTKVEFEQALGTIMQKDTWILDGNYNRTLAMRFKECDTIFFLDLPLDVCIQSVTSRIGKKREDMPWIEEVFDEEFYQYILNFPQDMLPEIYALLERFASCKKIITFHSREEVNNYLNKKDL